MAFFKLLNPDLPHHIAKVPNSRDFRFNQTSLTRDLRKAGASNLEAERLLDLLHDIGWGGAEFPPAGAGFKNFTRPELRNIIDWFRTRYLSQKIQDPKSQLDQFHEDIAELKIKKLFGHQAQTVHFAAVHKMKGKKLE